jgi:hypothetical protein
MTLAKTLGTARSPHGLDGYNGRSTCVGNLRDLMAEDRQPGESVGPMAPTSDARSLSPNDGWVLRKGLGDDQVVYADEAFARWLTYAALAPEAEVGAPHGWRVTPKEQRKRASTETSAPSYARWGSSATDRRENTA